MTSVQLNVRTSATLLEEIDNIVEMGGYRNRTEFVNEALRASVRRYRVRKILENIEAIAKKNRGDRDLSDIIREARDEGDRL